MMDRRHTVIVGAALVIFGVYLLFAEYGYPIRLHISWPVILIVIGGAMIAAYLTSKPRKNYLFGGSLVLWLGLFFLMMENFLKLHYGYGRLWPGFIIVLGLAHLTTAVINPAMRRHLSAAAMFIGLGTALFFFTLRDWRDFDYRNGLLILGILIIILGFKLIVQFLICEKGKA